MKRTDIIWQTLDTNNQLLATSNKFNHYHGVLDGLSNLDKQPEFTDIKEMGVMFTALDKESEPLSIKSWWTNNKWYIYGTCIGILSLILCCGLSWLCTCADCCVLKFFCNPCMTCYKQAKDIRKKRELISELQELPPQTVNPATKAIVMQLLSKTPRLGLVKTTQGQELISTSEHNLNASAFNEENETISIQPSERSRNSRKTGIRSIRRNRKHRNDVSLSAGVI